MALESNDISTLLELSEDYSESRTERRTGSQEFFTPSDLVQKMCNKVPEEQWKNTEADFLESSFGNGQFVLAIINRKINSGSTWQQALEHTWGVELFQDNVNECHNRVIELLQAMEVPDFDEKKARKIMKENLVCSNFFKWDFENWCPIEDKKNIETIPLF